MRSFIAYIDPGTGSFALQAVIGSVMGAAFMARTQIKNLMNKFKKPRQKPEKE